MNVVKMKQMRLFEDESCITVTEKKGICGDRVEHTYMKVLTGLCVTMTTKCLQKH